MALRVRKAVFPVAGFGTRFLPATKAMPKEMLTVVDRPLIQHVVDEAMEAGIEHFIFVTGRNKGVIEDHFDRQFELEQVLAARGKTSELEASRRGSARTRQHELHPPAGAARPRPRGLVRARARRQRALRAAPSRRAGADAKARAASPRCSTSMRAHGGNIIAVEPVPQDQAKNYGVVVDRRRRRARLSHRRHGGEAAAGDRALQPHHSRPLHPPARDLRSSCRRRRKEPAARSRSPTP